MMEPNLLIMLYFSECLHTIYQSIRRVYFTFVPSKEYTRRKKEQQQTWISGGCVRLQNDCCHIVFFLGRFHTLKNTKEKHKECWESMAKYATYALFLPLLFSLLSLQIWTHMRLKSISTYALCLSWYYHVGHYIPNRSSSAWYRKSPAITNNTIQQNCIVTFFPNSFFPRLVSNSRPSNTNKLHLIIQTFPNPIAQRSSFILCSAK